MGPPNTTEVLAMAYALGVDEAISAFRPGIRRRRYAGHRLLPWLRASRRLGSFDLVLFGNESLDGSTGQVGPQVAEFLDMPSITRVEKIDFVDDAHHAGQVPHRRRLHGHRSQAAGSPCRDQGHQHATSHARLRRSVGDRETDHSVCRPTECAVDKEQIGLAGSPTWVPDVVNIEMKRKGEIIKGEPARSPGNSSAKLRAAGALPEA